MTVNRLTLRHCSSLSNNGKQPTTVYCYIRTSRQRIEGTAGSDPETQAYQLRQADVPDANIYRDVGVSRGTGTNSRAGWRALDRRLRAGNTLVVVALDRIGRRWMDTLSATRDLRKRGVSIRSLADTEWSWIKYLESASDSPEAFFAEQLISLCSYANEQEMHSASRRTKGGLAKAVVAGQTLGPPRKVTDDQVEEMARLRREGLIYRGIGKRMRPQVSGTTVLNKLRERQA